MVKVNRCKKNPILKPDKNNSWEKDAVFNCSVVKNESGFHLVYRAVSDLQNYEGSEMKVSTIGYAQSNDGINFGKRKQLIKPEFDWERFGCEDPRITGFNDKFYIFYTALSEYPFKPFGIKVGVAVTKDFKKIEKHPVTPFNSKAMALFPEKINGKIAAILTANTDMPPAKIGIAFFDDESQIWSKPYWERWYQNIDSNTLSLLRFDYDQVEVGAVPVKTPHGWLLIYCYIRDYLSDHKIFTIEAALLDINNPLKIIGTTKEPILVPEKDYELFGNVPNVIFPSSALIDSNNLNIYYGATDTTCCLATCNLKDLIKEILIDEKEHQNRRLKLNRFQNNPIITPGDNSWESQYAFNPSAVFENGKVHLLYRAMGEDGTSVLGYANSIDGIKIDERLDKPVYVPREDFEKKLQPGNSGCEDPRITKLEDKFYICYTAFDGKNPTRVALTSIKVNDFLNKKFSWEKPVLISPPGRDDKDACLLPKKINNKYVIFHRLDQSIWIDYLDDLNFNGKKWLGGKILFNPRVNRWDNEKIGIGAPPIETEKGWLLIYHGLSRDTKYRLGLALLDLNDPSKVIERLGYPILEPQANYENKGLRFGTVFAGGAVLIDRKIYVYYGAADQVTCVATISLDEVLNKFF